MQLLSFGKSDTTVLLWLSFDAFLFNAADLGSAPIAPDSCHCTWLLQSLQCWHTYSCLSLTSG